MNRTRIESEINRINRLLKSRDPEVYLDDERRENYTLKLDKLEQTLAKLDDFEDDDSRTFGKLYF